MNVVDIMTHPVLTVGSNETVLNVAKLLVERHISGVPVVNAAGTVVGMVTESDLLRRRELGTEQRRGKMAAFFASTQRLSEEYIQANGRIAEEIMTRDVVSAGPETALSELVDLMERHRIKRVPVMQDGKLIGIVTRADLVRALAMMQPEPDAAHVTDRQIRRHLMQEISGMQWRKYQPNNISVVKGVVHFWGLIDSPREFEALKVAAEGIPGVNGVVDHTIISSAMIPMGM